MNKDRPVIVYWLALAAIAIALVVYKLRFLSLPYYWDEAWPYATGVRLMGQHGLSLVPGAIPPDVSRGHPLVFHFLAAAWMKIFGTSLIAGHCFALTVSVALLIIVFDFCRTFLSARVGIAATMLLAAQPVFIAQSAFLLPEMLMALWTMLCLYAWFRNKRWLICICCTAMLLTKESGVVLPLVLAGQEVVAAWYGRHGGLRTMLRRVWPVCVAAMVMFSFFFVQRLRFGWFFLPLYTDFLKNPWHEAAHNIPSAAAYLFVYGGRNGISAVVVLASAYVFFARKECLNSGKKQILAVLAVFIGCYWLFCGVNYYIPRYMLCAFPPFAIIAAVLADKMLDKLLLPYWSVMMALSFTGIWFYLYSGNSGDKDYAPSVHTAKEMVRYCERQGLNGKHIYTTSLLRDAMTNPYSGYLSGAAFPGLHWQLFPDTEYCLFSSDEYNDAPVAEIKREHTLRLVKRISEGYSWCELYRVDR